MRPPVETASGLSAVLRGVVADMQHVSGADIVSIFLYDESTRTYYAPFAIGQPQEGLLGSLADMREQMARYLGDAGQGKVPDELSIHHYGSTVWLTVTRQNLIAMDAPSEIDSTFGRPRPRFGPDRIAAGSSLRIPSLRRKRNRCRIADSRRATLDDLKPRVSRSAR